MELRHFLPGRARFHVAGLRHSADLKETLERGLSALAGAARSEASTRTGNLLVRFDPAIPLERIATYIAALARGELARPDEGGPEDSGTRWHARPIGEIADELGTSATAGLTEAAACRRLKTHGQNVLPVPVARSAVSILTGQFASLPVALLGIAAGVSLLTGGVLEFAAIAGVVALNGAIGFAVESRSERTISSLSATPFDTPVTVIRDRKPVEAALSALVPGDLILLQRGAIIPADARVVSARGLSVSEAMLTGESAPVAKLADDLPDTPLPLGDRRNMLYRGTAVIGGSGAALVVATGPATQMGRIQRMLASAATPQTPMQRQLDHIGRQLVWLGLAVCGALFGIGTLRGFGLLQMLRSSVSLAVAAIPEALPTVATTTLALGIEDMRRRKVLVRRLDGVETLASVRVFCFDKTGTLTMNRMSVAALACERMLDIAPDGTVADAAGAAVSLAADARLARLLGIGALCSEAEIEPGTNGQPKLTGSPTENALVRLALDAGLDVAAERLRAPRLSMQQRSDAYRFMLTRHRFGDKILVAVKGSPGDVLDICTQRLGESGPEPMDRAAREAIEHANLAMAERALRVLGFAYKELDDAAEARTADASGLIWVGLAGLADPVRPDAPALMRLIAEAGIHRVIMTGDQVPTAQAVARQLGLGNGNVEVVDSAALAGLSAARIAETAQQVQVFARVSPADKLAIVRALQASGVVVAMAGDGINDSPAMKAADVGIAMGWSGTEAVREVADVVLQTDDLAAIGTAIERGRTTYANVRKSVRYLIGTNLSEIMVVLAATSAGFAEPLTPLQLLWLNLVSDVLPALGLAFEPPDPGLLHRPPQASEHGAVRARDLGAAAADGSVIAAGALAACGYGALRYGAAAETRTMTLGGLVIAQLLHALTCRSATAIGGKPLNRPLAAAVGGSLALQAAGLLLPGLRGFMGMAPLGPIDLAVTLGAGVLPWMVNEARKPAATRAG